jgi:hypothetical protein
MTKGITLPTLLLALALLLVPAAAGAEIRYFYDELGRLRGVLDPSATDGVAIYHYDAVGNILSIVRQPVTQVVIVEFMPKQGPVGTTVTIQGAGFSATPGSNTVTFNGTAATVSSASANQLVVTVPAGATTGTIGVTAPGGSATSSAVFTVATAPAAPTISSFSPTIGTPGTAVTITGTNFETTPAYNNLRFEGSALRATVGSASATSLGTTVPAGLTSSGPISVATPAGKVVSTQDFFVPVGSYAVSSVVTTARVTVGTPQGISIPTANKIALVVFDGSAGQRVSFTFSGSVPTSTVSLWHPDGSVLMNALSMSTSAGFIDTKVLTQTGPHTLVIDPDGTATGTVTTTIHNVVDVTGSITAGGAAVPITITTPGQNARLAFNGTTGQRVSLRRTNTTVTSVTIAILKPDGTTLTGPLFTDYLDAVELPTTGIYTVVGDPAVANTGNLTLTLYDVVDVTGSITIGGSAVTVTTPVPGQNARLTFSGTAGQRISLWMSNVTITTSDVSILNPDTAPLTVASGGVSTAGGFIDTTVLTQTGTHTILLDPRVANTGSMTFTLYAVPADLSGAITPGGSAVMQSFTTPGQNGTLTFSGTMGQRISLRMTSVTIIRAFVSIKQPDNSLLIIPTFVGTAGAFFDTKTLTQNGTQTIAVNPDVQFTGSITLTLYDVPADVTGTLTIGGSASTVTVTTPGQNGKLTFSGTANQQLTVHVTSNTVGLVTVQLKKPDAEGGGLLTTSTSSAASFNLATQTLPTTGTYSIVVDPDQANTGGLAVSVTSP